MRAILFAALLAAPGCAATLTAAEVATDPTHAELIRWLVAHQGQLRDVPFSEVVRAVTGKRILPVDPTRDAAMLKRLGAALDATLRALNNPAHPIHRAARVNEASRYIEDEIRAQVNRLRDWKCAIPRTSNGKEQRAGYPDLRVVTDSGAVIYLDPKLYEAGSRDSSLRTFYYEPRALTGKIHDDAFQMLVGIAHSGTDAARMRLTEWELVDVSKLRVSLKAEFQAGNDRIYRSGMIVGRSAR